MQSKTVVEVFQAPCCNPTLAAALTRSLANVKNELGDRVEIHIYNMSSGDEGSFMAFATLRRYVREKGLDSSLPPGLPGIIAILPAIAINGSLEMLRDWPTQEQIMQALSGRSRADLGSI